MNFENLNFTGAAASLSAWYAREYNRNPPSLFNHLMNLTHSYLRGSTASVSVSAIFALH